MRDSLPQLRLYFRWMASPKSGQVLTFHFPHHPLDVYKRQEILKPGKDSQVWATYTQEFYEGKLDEMFLKGTGTALSLIHIFTRIDRFNSSSTQRNSIYYIQRV